MRVTRRDFLKLSGAAAATTLLAEVGFDLTSARAKVQALKLEAAKAVPTICPYCSSGCGILVYTKDGEVVATEGDPDHPISRGGLCSKGAAVYQIHHNERRLTKPLYRAPGSDRWEEKEWDWVLDQITQRIKATRDANFIEQENGITVNRTEAIASLGGAALDNEECYLLQKLLRALGLVYIEHQARI